MGVNQSMFPGSLEKYKNLSIIKLTIESQSLSMITTEEIDVLKIEGNRPKYNVLFFHGNGYNLNNVNNLGQLISQKIKCRFFCPEYKGYGERQGTGSEEDCQKIAEATVKHLE
jgi:hypothetical protein